MSRLPGGVGEDRLVCAFEGQEHVLVPLVGAVGLRDFPLLFADVGPCLIKLNATDLEIDHHAVMQLVAAFANPHAQPHDGVAVDAGQTFGGADAHTLGEGDLLVMLENVHGPIFQDGTGRPCPAGKRSPQSVYWG
jgi:hypothetical protein